MRPFGFSAEKESVDYSFRNPRIEVDLERKCEKFYMGTWIAQRQKNGGRWETRTLDLIRVKDAF